MDKNISALVVIGLAKNVGKTTTLNYILQNVEKDKTVAVTSIGVDGEDVDVVFGNDKPLVYVRSGSIVATARGFLRFCDFTKEVLKVTDFSTSVGDVVILRCLTDGYARIAGPGIGRQMESLIRMLGEFGADKILIDGALDRRTFVNPRFVEGLVLATGASISPSLDKVVELTGVITTFLSLETLKYGRVKVRFKELEDAKMLGLSNGLESLFEADIFNLDALKNLTLFGKEGGFLLIKGVVTELFMKRLISIRKNFSKIDIIVKDGTKLLISGETYDFFIRKEGSIKVLEKLDLRCITVNPMAPDGYKFDSTEFVERVSVRTGLPVFDVMVDNGTNLPI